MPTANKIPFYRGLVEKTKPYLTHNAEAFDIYQGSLLKYVEADLFKQLNKKSYERARWRIPPINVLKRIVDKLSKIYQPGPIRTVEGGTDTDAALLAWYSENMRIDNSMNTGNEHFNLFKNALLEPYVCDGYPRLRVIPSDRFIPYSESKTDDTKPTGYVLCQGKVSLESGQSAELYKAIEADTFTYFLDDGTNVTQRFAPEDNPEGINTYGVLPFVYVNRSPHCIMPVQDSDTLRMTKLIPLLLTDANLIALFQAYSVFYGINVNDENMTWGPDTFLSFKSDAGAPELKPEIGVLTPSQNVDGTLNLVASQLAFWLNSRGIRPGSVGEITAANFQSGVSKLIDEMDTSEDRGVQVDYFEVAERQLWELIFQHLHPVWASEGIIENKALWTPSAKVSVRFAEQLPPMRRGEVVTEVTNELAAGLTTRTKAVMRLNPELTEEQAEELIKEIDGVEEPEADGMATPQA